MPGQKGGPGDWHHHFVDFQRVQSVADVIRSTGAGMRSVVAPTDAHESLGGDLIQLDAMREYASPEVP